jgi:hypothetical protein
MPRIANRFTISQLENMLSSKRNRLDSLAHERSQLQKQLDALDTKIRSLGGGRMGGGVNAGGRARNEKSLVESIEAVLAKSGKPTSVGDILDGVQASGYRSNSANFRGIINQTLIKERKRFSNAGRGLYALKK